MGADLANEEGCWSVRLHRRFVLPLSLFVIVSFPCSRALRVFEVFGRTVITVTAQPP